MYDSINLFNQIPILFSDNSKILKTYKEYGIELSVDETRRNNKKIKEKLSEIFILMADEVGLSNDNIKEIINLDSFHVLPKEESGLK